MHPFRTFWWIFIAVLATAFFATTLWAEDLPPMRHDPEAASHWYPRECCSLKDCYPIPKEDVDELPEGFFLKSHEMLFPLDKVRESKDEQYHLCTDGGRRNGHVIGTPGSLYGEFRQWCMFVPQFGGF